MIKILLDYIIIWLSGMFDRSYYLEMYPDVKEAKVNPLFHYIRHGWEEGRNPSNEFDTNLYLELTPEVQEAGLNPLTYYLLHGRKRGHQNRINLSETIQFLNKFLNLSIETRKKVQQSGINVLPVNFYSSTPSVQEIEESYEYHSDSPPYLIPELFDQSRFRKVLEQLIPYSEEFNPPLEGVEEDCHQFFWKNSQFSFSDAMAYYCFLRMTKPTSIVEIGSGFSTLIALEAIQKNGHGSITCIEPYPREFIRNNKLIALHCVQAQEIQPDFLNDIFQDGDILFLDSTHTVKTGSDSLHIFLRLLPQIKRNITVHVHDVFLPFGLPKEWLLDYQLFWTEQYLLLAFLIDNPKVALLYGSNYNTIWNPELMEKMMGDKYPFRGGSLWFNYDGRRAWGNR